MIKNQFNITNAEDVYFTDAPEQKVNSVLSQLLTEISLSPIVYEIHRRIVPADVIVKVKHNNLRSQRFILTQYQTYSATIETSYANIDKSIVNGKAKVLIILEQLYAKALSEFGLDLHWDEMNIEIIRDNADSIIEKIIKDLKVFCYKSANVPPDKESVEIGVNVIVAHAFVECLILENPNATH